MINFIFKICPNAYESGSKVYDTGSCIKPGYFLLFLFLIFFFVNCNSFVNSKSCFFTIVSTFLSKYMYVSQFSRRKLIFGKIFHFKIRYVSIMWGQSIEACSDGILLQGHMFN